MTTRISFFKAWLPPIIWMGIIFAISSVPTMPRVGLIWWDVVLKKSAHIGEYAILTGLVARAFQLNGWKLERSLTAAVIVSFFYAITDEWHQTFVPGRTGIWYDVGFDTLGSLLMRAGILRFPWIRRVFIRDH